MNISPLSGDGSTDSAAQSQASLRVQDLLNKQEWLLEQKVQLEAQVLASNPGFAEELDTMNAEELQQLCDSLQAELLVKTSVHDSRQNLLQSERINQAAMSALKSDDSSSAKVQSLFTEMTRLAEEVGKQHKENVELQAELDKYKRENRELQNKSRELYSHIEKKKKEKEEEIAVLTNDPSGKSITAQLKSKLDVHKVQSNVLQKLILGSGVNWAQDEKLQSIVLECGQSVNIGC